MDRPFARRVLPEFTERAPDGSRRTVDPYSKLLAERIVMLGTPLDEAAAGDVVAQLLHLESAAPDRPISLHLNSPGGSFTAMTAVLDALGFVGCEVETVCLGQASSVAALLLAAGTPGRRLALPHARVVIGQPTTAEPYQGQPSDIERHAAELLRQRETLIRLLARHTGQSERTIGRDIERETVFDAERARAYGLVDHLTRARGARGSARIGG